MCDVEDRDTCLGYMSKPDQVLLMQKLGMTFKKDVKAGGMWEPTPAFNARMQQGITDNLDSLGVQASGDWTATKFDHITIDQGGSTFHLTFVDGKEKSHLYVGNVISTVAGEKHCRFLGFVAGLKKYAEASASSSAPQWRRCTNDKVGSNGDLSEVILFALMDMIKEAHDRIDAEAAKRAAEGLEPGGFKDAFVPADDPPFQKSKNFTYANKSNIRMSASESLMFWTTDMSTIKKG